MTAHDPSRPHPAVRAVIVAVLVLALLGLGVVLWVGPFGASEPPSLARAQARVRIVDEAGRPVTTATVFALGREVGAPIAERWLPDQAVLALPEGAGSPSFLVAARGYRLQRIDDVRGDRVLTLRRGLLVRLTLRNAPRELPEPHIRFLLRIRPDADLVRATPGLDAPGLVDLMGHIAGRHSGPRGLPRGEFGFAVSRAQGNAGVRVPLPGRYHVHWGLMDLRAGTWFSLGDRCGRMILVHEEREGAAYAMDVAEGDLQQTLEGLSTSVQRLGE